MIIKKLFHLIFLTKKKFNVPLKKKVVIFDSDGSEVFKKYFKNKDIEILDSRFSHEKNEKLNLYILFKNLIKFKLSTKDYYEEYINHVNPKILITLTDNNSIFYRLKTDKNIIKISVQRAFRSLQAGDILIN